MCIYIYIVDKCISYIYIQLINVYIHIYIVEKCISYIYTVDKCVYIYS